MTFKSEIDPVIERQSIDATSPSSCLELTSSDPNSMEQNMAQDSPASTSHPPIPPLPPATQMATAAPDPFDPSQFAANSTIVGDAGVVKQLVVCPVRKPNKQEFVRVHPDPKYRLEVHIIELKNERELYLVMPSVAAALPGETRSVTLTLTVNRQGSAFLWPVPTPSLRGRENDWHTSARAGATHGVTNWVKLVSNSGSYDVLAAPGALGNPVWPNNSMRDLLAIAFGETFTIRDLSHPVIKRLLGQS